MDINVDVAVVLPVNVTPLIDDTDRKTRETAIVYNQAGMDLVWNFVTTAGVFTQTAVTPTTSGDYDWTNKGGAMYGIEIPPSGGADINNNIEGTGWFTGFCTGVLPWASERYTFRPASLNNLLVNTSSMPTDIATLISSDMPLSRTSGTLVANGTEQTLYENAAPTDIWIADTIAIDITNLTSEISIAVKVYCKIKEFGSYVKFDTQNYSAAQINSLNEPGIIIQGIPNRYGYKVTLHQWAGGAFKSFDWERFNRG